MMDPGRRIRQPGPTLEPRVLAVPCRARHACFTLAPGEVLLEAISRRLGPCRGAVLHLEGGGFGPFQYVMPAPSPNKEHAAFYSGIRTPAGITRLETGRVTYGTRDGVPWLHCHGFWTEANGHASGGHVIPDTTRAALPITVEAWVLDGAGFVARHDLETNFTLFAPEPAIPTGQGSGRFYAMRLKPNQDLCTTLETFCAGHGIEHARLLGGVASIIGASFADGTDSTAFATEIFLREATIDGAARIDIGLVNDRDERAAGLLRRGANPVLMTAELLLEVQQPGA